MVGSTHMEGNMRSNNVGVQSKAEGEERKTVVIRNRDIPLLANVLPIMQMISKTEEMRRWQEERMTSITTHLSGMPGGRGVAGGFEETLALLSEIDESRKQLCAEYAETLTEAEAILNGIESVSMRAFVTMKYVMDVPDIQIRRELGMSLKRFYGAKRCIEDAEDMASVKWNEKYICGKQ